MRYQINEYVKVKSLNKVKQISDYEKINGLDIYYMSDVTAYPENDLISINGNDLIDMAKSYYLSEERENRQVEHAINYLKNKKY